MNQVKRPTSPHLSIYRLPLAAKMSIMHRITGVALYAGALLLVWWLAVAAYAPTHYLSFHDAMTSVCGRVVLFGFTVAFYYHLANGIRHLFWDMGKGFKLGSVNLSGVLALLFALIASTGSWCYAYHVVGKI